ncbi:MAG: xanthine dehydrogenase family protein molybdopterin-binding subunit, partial [Gammaproteobacteria bacterium]
MAVEEADKSGLVGARVQRVEDPRLLTGRGQYLDDIGLPTMLEGCGPAQAYPHARIVSIDASAALEMPGVFDVLTGRALAELVEPQPV